MKNKKQGNLKKKKVNHKDNDDNLNMWTLSITLVVDCFMFYIEIIQIWVEFLFNRLIRGPYGSPSYDLEGIIVYNQSTLVR